MNEAPIVLGLLDDPLDEDGGDGERRTTRWRLLRARVLWWFTVVLVAEAAALPVLIVVE